jgi:hypothetical protein
MNKFPILNFYQNALNILGVIVLVGGFLIALTTSSSLGRSFGGGGLIVFVSAYLPFLISAIGLGITAEIIKLFLRIEDHLDQMQRMQRQLLATRPPMYSEAAKSPSRSIEQPLSQKADNFIRTDTYKAKQASKVLENSDIWLEAIVIPERTMIRARPNTKYGVRGAAMRGQVVRLLGRNADNTWAVMDKEASMWINVSELSVRGNLEALPIIENTQPKEKL